MSTAESPLAAPMNHVFVDFENVPDIDLSVIGGKATTFTLFLGAKNTKLDVTLVERLLAHAASVNLIRLTGAGKNALDFTLAYYVGRTAVNDPHGYFHIVSKDAGYDPLVQHLRSRHIRAHRHVDFSALTFSGTSKPVPVVTPPNDTLNKVLEHLRKNTTNRPKRKKTLSGHLLSFLGKNGTDASVTTLIASLATGGYLLIDEKEAVTYNV